MPEPQRVRDEMGLVNAILMIPFVRRVAEAERVPACMADLDFKHGEDGLQVYAMCEIPNNVVLIDVFARHFVEAPSDYPEMAECLVETGIDSMSLNPDTVLKTTRHVLDVERRLGHTSR